MKALITGASSGIGRDIATELAKKGYDLILVARNIEKLNQVKENILTNCNNINIKIFLFIIFCFPVFLLSLFGFNGENIVYVIFYIFKFLIKNKILLFIK